MSLHHLLVLLFLSIAFALPAPPLLRQPTVGCDTSDSDCTTTPETVVLRNGIARHRLNVFFELNDTDLDKLAPPTYTIVKGPRIITTVQIGSPTPPSGDHNNIVYSVDVSFGGLPGPAELRIDLVDNKRITHSKLYLFAVVGLVLYEEQGDEPHILTGLNPNTTVVQALDGNTFGTTVNVSLFPGDPTTTTVPPHEIRLIVDPEYADILPWDPEACPITINTDPSILDSRCAMAFSVDFTSFSVRIPPEKEFTDEIRVQFEWVGMRDYQEATVGEDGIANSGDPISLESDVITSILLGKQSGGRGRSTVSSTLAGWKIGVIAITSVLLVIAAVTLVCCYLCGKKRTPKKPEPDVVGFKDKFQEIGFLRRMSTIRRGIDDDDDDQCYVEEPPSPEDSEILMLENESRGHRRSVGRSVEGGHIEGLIPMDRLNDDKSAERLVLPRGVTRGVDLGSSTEGASAFGYGPPSGENDITSYGRGMTSVPRDNFAKPNDYRSSRERSSRGSRRTDTDRSRDGDYLRDSHERVRSLERDRAHIREVERELERERSARERSEERMRPRSSAEQFPESDPAVQDRTNGVLSRNRTGVGAAINRIRQLDLLYGPASRGLVGRNGEPIPKPAGEERSPQEVAAMSASSVS